MNKVTLFALIVPRDEGDRWQRFLFGLELKSLHSFPCLGTASKTLRGQLGLQSNEKTLFLAATPHRHARTVLRHCVDDMGLNIPGSGIAADRPRSACCWAGRTLTPTR